MYIRDAVERDLEAIVKIYNQSIPHRTATADTEPITVASRLNWFRDRSNNRPLWVVESEGTVVGWLSFQPFYGRPAYRYTAELSIYINYSDRGRGIGSKLLEQAIASSPQLAIKTLLGFIFAHNHVSLKLFTNYGFTAWGRLPQVAELDGIEKDLVILGRRVDANE